MLSVIYVGDWSVSACLDLQATETINSLESLRVRGVISASHDPAISDRLELLDRGQRRQASVATSRPLACGTGIHRLIAKLVLNPQQLVVFGDALTAAQRTSFDLACTRGDS